MSEYPINVCMIPPIIQSNTPITLLGGAPLETKHLAEALALAPLLVAADGGGGKALAAGYTPKAVIGDMDSLSDADRARLDPATVFEIREQESTDFHKALRHIAAPLVLAVGFTGARLDHELSVYNVLVRQPAGSVLVLGEADLCFHAPRRLSLDLPLGTRVSLFPMAPVSGRSHGLRWPIDGLTFAPDGRAGTSNESVSAPVGWELEGPGMLAILPRGCLTLVVRALLASGSRAG